MIKLITKDNARVGMVVNVHNQDGSIWESKVTITSIFDTYFGCNGRRFDFDYGYFSLVSLPERRKLTWENVKDLPCPFDNYNDESKETILFKDEEGFLVRYDTGRNNEWYNWGDLLDGDFLDPPYPEIPESVEPWLTKNTGVISTIEDHVNKITRNGAVGLEYPIKEEDKPSLWWSMRGDNIRLHDYFVDRKQIKVIMGDLPVKIQPYNQASQFSPIESAWEEV